MQKVIIKHLNGSKSNQTETFMLPVDEILFGRESDCQVIYDPEKDDLVSRKHLKLAPQGDNRFLLSDLNSRNGTFVNGAKISGPVEIHPGDRIQLGADGPEFVFDLDPRPPAAPPETRLAVSGQVIPKTREYREPSASVSAESAEQQVKESREKPATSSDRIGRNTVERLITGVRSDTRRKMINVGGGILAIIVAISGFFIYQNMQEKAETEDQLADVTRTLDDQIRDIKAAAGKSPAEVASEYAASTVFIEAAWKLIDVETGRQMYQRVGCLVNKRKCVSKKLPWYIYINGSVEPYLVAGGEGNIPIGNRGHTGSGFVVKEDGFILTNRHVAAHWETESSSNFTLPGILMVCNNDDCSDRAFNKEWNPSRNDPYLHSLLRWVPSKSKMWGGKPATGKRVAGRNDYLDVTFPGTKLRVPARLVRVSDSADVALIKIDLPQPVKAVSMGAEDPVVRGSPVTVMGYPGISPDIVVQIKSQDPKSREPQLRIIPEPTVTSGIISKVIKGDSPELTDAISGYFSEMGDVYQLDINATGAGNSGGPVFNDEGRVIGIFTYSASDRQGTKITFAVPIKHGLEIMGVQRVFD